MVHPTITVRIDPDTRWRLVTLMVRLGLSRSEVIRLAVTQLAEREGLPERPECEPMTGQVSLDDLGQN